jgi:uncharacterized delta-60 repeat protein
MNRNLIGNVFLFLCISSLSGCGDDVRVNCPDGSSGEKWVWDGTVCSLRRDGFNWSVSSIAPALDGSGDLYTVGSFTHFKRYPVKHIARLNTGGSLDKAFVSGADFFSPQIVVTANDGSGDIYVGGLLGYDGSTHRGIARLNQDRSLDPGFDTGAGIGRNVQTIVPTTDGSGDVYVGGPSTSPSLGNGPVRLNSDGSQDVDFNPGFGAGEQSIALATDGSGDIYVSRSSTPYIARLNDDGSIDTGFDTGASGFDRSVIDIAVATDGSGDIYVTGFFREYNGASTSGLARLNSDGSLDTGFVVNDGLFLGGRFVIPLPDGSGDIYVHASNTSKQNILRLNHDGSIDAGFGIGSEGLNYNGSISDAAIAIDGSGDIYLAGDFTHYNSVPAVMLARLSAQGSLVR